MSVGVTTDPKQTEQSYLTESTRFNFLFNKNPKKFGKLNIIIINLFEKS
jgi:hypothetical protein